MGVVPKAFIPHLCCRRGSSTDTYRAPANLEVGQWGLYIELEFWYNLKPEVCFLLKRKFCKMVLQAFKVGLQDVIFWPSAPWIVCSYRARPWHPGGSTAHRPFPIHLELRLTHWARWAQPLINQVTVTEVPSSCIMPGNWTKWNDLLWRLKTARAGFRSKKKISNKAVCVQLSTTSQNNSINVTRLNPFK